MNTLQPTALVPYQLAARLYVQCWESQTAMKCREPPGKQVVACGMLASPRLAFCVKVTALDVAPARGWLSCSMATAGAFGGQGGRAWQVTGQGAVQAGH